MRFAGADIPLYSGSAAGRAVILH